MHLDYNEEEDILTVRPVETFKGPETEIQSKENTDSVISRVGTTLKGCLAFLPSHYINARATRHYRNTLPDNPIALVGDSFFKKMIGNFLLSFADSKRPMKIFTNEEEALQWLKDQISERDSSTDMGKISP